jgi:hypothetical protein
MLVIVNDGPAPTRFAPHPFSASSATMQHMRHATSFSKKSRTLFVSRIPLGMSHVHEIGFKYFMPIITYAHTGGST